MKKNNLKLVLVAGFGISLFALTDCTKDKTPYNPGNIECLDTISFNQQILPMIQNNCISCHDVGQTNPTLTNYSEISANASNISGTLHGQPILMPEGGPALADSLLQQFSCWIQQGKQEN